LAVQDARIAPCHGLQAAAVSIGFARDSGSLVVSMDVIKVVCAALPTFRAVNLGAFLHLFSLSSALVA
jgi:hypothetical protein